MTAASLQFREWLVNQLARTGWARRSEPVETLAVALGVQPSVLEEARARGRQQRVETASIVLKFPEAIFERWNHIADAQALEGALLLRGLIEAFLRNGKLPEWTGRFWFFGDRKYDVDSWRQGNWPWKVRAEISRGADLALEHISALHKTTKTALVRGHVIDYLEGRTRQVILIGASDMYGAPERYLAEWGL